MVVLGYMGRKHSSLSDVYWKWSGCLGRASEEQREGAKWTRDRPGDAKSCTPGFSMPHGAACFRLEGRGEGGGGREGGEEEGRQKRKAAIQKNPLTSFAKRVAGKQDWSKKKQNKTKRNSPVLEQEGWDGSTAPGRSGRTDGSPDAGGLVCLMVGG